MLLKDLDLIIILSSLQLTKISPQKISTQQTFAAGNLHPLTRANCESCMCAGVKQPLLKIKLCKLIIKQIILKEKVTDNQTHHLLRTASQCYLAGVAKPAVSTWWKSYVWWCCCCYMFFQIWVQCPHNDSDG